MSSSVSQYLGGGGETHRFGGVPAGFLWSPGWVRCPPHSLIDGGDVALGHNGFEAQDDVDAEEDGDAVVAIADVRFHVLLRFFFCGERGGTETDTSASSFGGPPKTPRDFPPPKNLTRNMVKVFPMTALKRSWALGPVTIKKSQRNKYSRQLLSRRA